MSSTTPNRSQESSREAHWQNLPLMNVNKKEFTTYKPPVTFKNWKVRWDCSRNLLEKASVWNQILSTDENKMHVYQNGSKRREWKKRGTANDPSLAASCVKPAWGSVMVWPRTSEQAHWCLLVVRLLTEEARWIEQNFKVQINNGPKHTANATQTFLKGLQWPSQSPDLTSVELSSYWRQSWR